MEKVGAFRELAQLLIWLILTQANETALSRSYWDLTGSIQSHCDKGLGGSLDSMNPEGGCDIVAAGHWRLCRAEQR